MLAAELVSLWAQTLYRAVRCHNEDHTIGIIQSCHRDVDFCPILVRWHPGNLINLLTQAIPVRLLLALRNHDLVVIAVHRFLEHPLHRQFPPGILERCVGNASEIPTIGDYPSVLEPLDLIDFLVRKGVAVLVDYIAGLIPMNLVLTSLKPSPKLCLDTLARDIALSMIPFLPPCLMPVALDLLNVQNLLPVNLAVSKADVVQDVRFIPVRRVELRTRILICEPLFPFDQQSIQFLLIRWVLSGSRVIWPATQFADSRIKRRVSIQVSRCFLCDRQLHQHFPVIRPALDAPLLELCPVRAVTILHSNPVLQRIQADTALIQQDVVNHVECVSIKMVFTQAIKRRLYALSQRIPSTKNFPRFLQGFFAHRIWINRASTQDRLFQPHTVRRHPRL